MAIVASLVFVGLELRQNGEIARAAAYQARAIAHADSMYSTAANELALTAYRKGADGDRDSITPLEGWSGFYATAGALSVADNSHYQWEQGFLSEDDYEGLRVMLAGVMRNPFQRWAILNNPESMRPSFRELVLQIDEENGGGQAVEDASN